MRRFFPRMAEALFGDTGRVSPEPLEPEHDDAHADADADDDARRRPADGPRSDSLFSARSSVMLDAPALDGGLQGLPSQTLMVDEDGDEAHEFLVVDRGPRPSGPT